MDSATFEQLIRQAERWLADDPDPKTAAELAVLIEKTRRGDGALLAEAFDGNLAFGTAGLRGRLGPGSRRMNRVVVARAAAGLAAYLQKNGGRSVVIGYDARHNSDIFARDTAEIMAGTGLSAMLLPRPLPTPVLAFAIRHLDASAGVMVTASHNPPQDNGYKVYLGDGRQIVPPADAEISAMIDLEGPVSELPRSTTYHLLNETVVEAYLQRATGLLPPGPRSLRVVYNPMHGVGGELFMRATAACGFPKPVVVTAQFNPDPDFPTTPFPNPEEPGAMDLALHTAREAAADIVIANDPDADRCAAAIPAGDDWHMLTGDETGALLGWWIVQRRRAQGLAGGVLGQSLVSGTLLRAIAEEAGLGYRATLTGFKWISRIPELVYGYEEAIGYCVDPDAVADKDGITAALLLLELAAALKAEGRGIQDLLDDLYRRFGLHMTGQISIRVADPTRIIGLMARLRRSPPAALGDRRIVSLDDFEYGIDGLPPADGLRLNMDGARVIIRPSGTEPKLKCYLQMVVAVEAGLDAARVAAIAGMEQLKACVNDMLGVVCGIY